MKYAYYRDCSELSIYLFHKILETGDHTLLLHEPRELEDMEREELEGVWREIYEQYCKLSEDNQSLMYYSLFSEVVYLQTRHIMCSELLKRLIVRMDSPCAVEKYSNALAKWKYRINPDKPLEKEIEKLIKVLKVSENKIRLKKDELEKFAPDEGEKMSLTEQVVKLELILGKNEIDPKTTSVEKWIVMIKEVEKKNELRKKASR